MKTLQIYRRLLTEGLKTQNKSELIGSKEENQD